MFPKNNVNSTIGYRKIAAAWLVLTLALAVHVTDEALTGFLDVYNPTVRAIHAEYPLIPLPTFSYEKWLGGLTATILVLTILSLFISRGGLGVRYLCYFYGLIMIGNAFIHIGGSIFLGSLQPGVYSSPLLLICSVILLQYTRRKRSEPQNLKPIAQI